MTKSDMEDGSLAWSLLYRAIRPAILPAPHSQPPGGVSSCDFLKPFSGCFLRSLLFYGDISLF
jgi:hypothetical protein